MICSAAGPLQALLWTLVSECVKGGDRLCFGDWGLCELLGWGGGGHLPARAKAQEVNPEHGQSSPTLVCWPLKSLHLRMETVAPSEKRAVKVVSHLDP